MAKHLGIAAAAAIVLLSTAGDAAACLTVPAPSKLVTSIYGWRFHPVFKTWRLHRGVDLRADMSTPLVASHGGVVQLASSASGGNELRIVGDDGTVSRYLHLTRATVDSGARVSPGQAVALSGNTGHASAAPHLHFEVYQSGAKSDINPEPLLCGGVTRKADADSAAGFPVQACNPDGGQCSGGSQGTIPPVAGGGSAGQPGVPAVKAEQFDDMSTAEIFETEVSKRFGNPDWYREQSERGVVPLLVEYMHMLALDQYLDFHKSQVRDRVETLLATKLARQNKREIAVRLQRQREATAKAGPAK
jgi:hypothetical protein